MPALSSPLILTAAFEPASRDLFQSLRDRYFPPELNVVPAHLTLFHHLPGEEPRRVAADIAHVSAGQGAMTFATAGVRFLGRGCALNIRCDDLVALRAALRTTWSHLLTKQDAQGFRPHVTVQNKVSPQAARALSGELAFMPPMAGMIVGLDLWYYRSGPWEHALHVPFSGTAR